MKSDMLRDAHVYRSLSLHPAAPVNREATKKLARHGAASASRWTAFRAFPRPEHGRPDSMSTVARLQRRFDGRQYPVQVHAHGRHRRRRHSACQGCGLLALGVAVLQAVAIEAKRLGAVVTAIDISPGCGRTGQEALWRQMRRYRRAQRLQLAKAAMPNGCRKNG